jgi:hypothetical protein
VGLPSVRATGGKAVWKWRVPTDAAVGTARAIAACQGAGRAARRLQISGAAVPASVEVIQQGFSQRNTSYSSEASYGLVLSNPSPDTDAVDVQVLVNFLDATNRVLESADSRLEGIPAGSTFYFGGSEFLPDATPVARLEVVIQVGGNAPKAIHAPAVADVGIVPAKYDPGFAGSVDGQIANDHPTMKLERAKVYVVLFDSAGNVVGGGSGFESLSLPPGERHFVSTSSGVHPVELSRAAAVQVSVEPTFEPSS